MENKRVHYILIPILLLLLVVYSYKKLNKNEEIQEKSVVEAVKIQEVKTEIKSKGEALDSIVQIGNCYSFEKDGNYYGVIMIKYEDDDLYTVALLDKTERKELKENNFVNGSLICTSNHMLPLGAYGLSTGFFMKEDLNVFQKNFKYVCHLDLDDSKIEINGGGSLIFNQTVSIKDLRGHRLLKEMKRYTEPTSKYLN